MAARLTDAYRDVRLRRAAAFLSQPYSRTVVWWREFRQAMGDGSSHDLELYLIVRSIRPTLVVETGVHRGWSSAALLRGLHANGHGRLVSIDLPGERVGWSDLSAADTGCEVPAYLRDRWELLLGDARDLLPSMSSYQMFFHDSDHSYAHQRFEYHAAADAMRPGNFIASDDVDWTPAFSEFARSMPAALYWTPVTRRRGAVRL